MPTETARVASGGKTGPRPRRARRADGLTDREVEVLRLGCTGLTNREIASKLVLSEKTVEHHFEHVYNKLGITSRTAPTDIICGVITDLRGPGWSRASASGHK